MAAYDSRAEYERLARAAWPELDRVYAHAVRVFVRLAKLVRKNRTVLQASRSRTDGYAPSRETA